jgi:DNA-binding NarL/FixJ family response regulator
LVSGDSRAITVLIADDHEPVREALKRLLGQHAGIAVVAEAVDGAGTVGMAAHHHPDVAVVDIGMKGMNGIEAAARLRDESPATAVLILTVYDQPHYVVRALEAGARGYLLKDCLHEDQLVEAIQALHAGKCFFGPEVADYVPARFAEAG